MTDHTNTETVTGYYQTYDDARAARDATMLEYGSAFRCSVITPPNHDRTTWVLSVDFDHDRIRPLKAVRRLDAFSGLGL